MLTLSLVLAAYALSCGLSYAFRNDIAGTLIATREKSGWFFGSFLGWLVALFCDWQHTETTIGRLVLLPVGRKLDDETARHEGAHADQCARLGWGNAWIGLPAFLVLYLIAPLPFGLAWFRYRFEREAYLRGGTAPADIADVISSKVYGWAWPRAWVLKGLT